MSQPNCELLVSVIDQLTDEIRAVDDQIQTLETEALGQENLFHYFKFQPRADHLLKEQRILQGRWNEAMTELALWRNEPSMRPQF